MTQMVSLTSNLSPSYQVKSSSGETHRRTILQLL